MKHITISDTCTGETITTDVDAVDTATIRSWFPGATEVVQNKLDHLLDSIGVDMYGQTWWDDDAAAFLGLDIADA